MNNQSNLLAEAGRPADGLAPIDEAVTIYRALAQADPTRFLPDLAASLNNQANLLRRPGAPPTGWPPSRKPSPSTAPSPRPTPPASCPTSPRR